MWVHENSIHIINMMLWMHYIISWNEDCIVGKQDCFRQPSLASQKNCWCVIYISLFFLGFFPLCVAGFHLYLGFCCGLFLSCCLLAPKEETCQCLFSLLLSAAFPFSLKSHGISRNKCIVLSCILPHSLTTHPPPYKTGLESTITFPSPADL